MIPGKTGRGVGPYREATQDKRLCEERETHSHPIHPSARMKARVLP